MDKNNEVLEIKNLKQYFNEGKRNEVRAIEDISLISIKETLGLVESQDVVNQLQVKQLLN